MKNDFIFQRNHSDGSLISIAGNIDVSTVRDFKDQLMSIAESSTRNLTLDCCQLDYMDSVGLAVLIGIQKMMMRKNLRIRLVNVREHIRKLLYVTHLDQIFGVAG